MKEASGPGNSNGTFCFTRKLLVATHGCGNESMSQNMMAYKCSYPFLHEAGLLPESMHRYQLLQGKPFRTRVTARRHDAKGPIYLSLRFSMCTGSIGIAHFEQPDSVAYEW